MKVELFDRLDFPNNAQTHNQIFRGKNLGTSVTKAQALSIKNGTFDDLYIGDYWTTPDGDKLVIAGFDVGYPVLDEKPDHSVTVITRLIEDSTVYGSVDQFRIGSGSDITECYSELHYLTSNITSGIISDSMHIGHSLAYSGTDTALVNVESNLAMTAGGLATIDGSQYSIVPLSLTEILGSYNNILDSGYDLSSNLILSNGQLPYFKLCTLSEMVTDLNIDISEVMSEGLLTRDVYLNDEDTAAIAMLRTDNGKYMWTVRGATPFETDDVLYLDQLLVKFSLISNVSE